MEISTVLYIQTTESLPGFSRCIDNQLATLLQTTALMGAHTIGACNRSNSGYAGTWITGGARAFDNEYYKVMLDDSSSTSWITEVRADIS